MPYQKLNTLEDVLEDEEAYANDILRKISYDSFGEQALVTSPLRMKSMGILFLSALVLLDMKRVQL